MPFDYQMNLETGDWVFNANRDFAGASGDGLIKQRIITRLKIPRGSFIYDTNGHLGSRILSGLSSNIPASIENVEILIREALEPMRDIEIVEIELQPGIDNQFGSNALVARINFRQRVFPGELNNPLAVSTVDVSL